MSFSARGAAGRKHPVVVVMERHFMKTHVCIMDEGPQEIFMLKDQQKKQREMTQLMAGVPDDNWDV